ncbi:MAG: hypothetical protein ACI9OJ_000679 [Myxococcota bacterium]|jgi:hypothetical protein
MTSRQSKTPPVMRMVLLCAALTISCGSDTTSNPPSQSCSENFDCPFATPVCVNSVCQEAVGCASDDQCGAGQKCLADGTCKTAECQTDAECCTGTDDCVRNCVEFKCVGSECIPGQSEGCFDGCHIGTRTCVNGLWLTCDAPPQLAAEVCDDDIDNDCNGKTDDGCAECSPGGKQTCSGPCGDGDQTCGVDGLWSDCSAPVDCTCEQGETFNEACGNCGEKAGNCGPDGTWIFSSLCTGEGLCEATKTDVQVCGNCGTQVRICSVDCAWDEWSKCGTEGPCAVGDTEKQACGNCGEQARTCGDDCQWGDWSECAAGQGCSEGQTQSKSCGLCGTQESICDGQCKWSLFGSCQSVGECQPFSTENEECGNCGSRSRVCSSECGWGDWSQCFGSGECVGGTQQEADCGPNDEEGLCEFGTQIRTCSPSCSWNNFGNCIGATYPTTEICGNGKDESCSGADEADPDSYEPNNSCSKCKHLGSDPNTFDSGALFGSFDQASDEFDYFCFTAIDNTSIPGFEESIRVTLTNQVGGIDADIYLYKGLSACNAGHGSELVKSVTIGGGNEEFEWDGSTGTDDAGEYYIELRNYEASGCSTSYTLNVDGFN